MGNRYFLTVTCPVCGKTEKDVYYAPTCGIKHFPCKCGHTINLEEYSGITEEEASNRDEIQQIVDEVVKKYES